MLLTLLLSTTLAAPAPSPSEPGFGDPLDRCSGPSETVGEQIRRETACLIRQAGPRALANPQGREAMFQAIRRALPPDMEIDQAQIRNPTLLACRRGERPQAILFLAHIDTVHPTVAGASDNAASIAILLAAARALPSSLPQTVCFGFPDGEEIGLRGSRALALQLTSQRESFADGALTAENLNLVISLDLIGQGRLTWNGLGPAWSTADLRALLRVAPADVPWVYRALSLHRPDLERSDHGPFAARGFRSAHLMSRGRGGVTWAYHTPRDDIEVLDPDVLEGALEIVTRLALDPPLGDPPSRGELALVLPWTRIVLPGWLSWAWLGLAGLSLIVPWSSKELWRRPYKPWGQALLWLLATPVIASATLMLAALGRPLGGALAGPALAAAWLAALAPGLWIAKPEAHKRWIALATLPLGLASIALLVLGLPLLVLPVVTAGAGLALASRLPPAFTLIAAPLACWPGAYLLRPDGWRELSFHGLVDGPIFAVVLFAALLPAALAWLPASLLADQPKLRSRIRLSHAAILAGLLAWAWLTPPWQEPYPEREVKRPLPRSGPSKPAEPG